MESLNNAPVAIKKPKKIKFNSLDLFKECTAQDDAKIRNKINPPSVVAAKDDIIPIGEKAIIKAE